jgi:hypothetical protein
MLDTVSSDKLQAVSLNVTPLYGDEALPSTFSNFVSVNTTGEEIILDFCELAVERAKIEGSVAAIPARARHRVIMTPQHALRFMAVLDSTLRQFQAMSAPPPAPKKET